MDSIQTTTTKKTNTGKIGFILCCMVLCGLAICSPLITTPLTIVLLPIWLLIIFVSAIFCIYGLIKKRARKLAITALIANIVMAAILPVIFITYTPPGSIPPPLNEYKFKRACSEAAFWLDFDKYHIMSVKSLNTGIIQKFGAISFYTKDFPYYPVESVIEFSEKNGWKYYCSFPLFKEDFQKFDLKTLSIGNEEESALMEVLSYCVYQSPILSKQDCTVLVFETDSPLGYPSYIFLAKDDSNGDTLIVFYQNPVRPDGYSDHLFQICSDLSEIRSKEMEDSYEN